MPRLEVKPLISLWNTKEPPAMLIIVLSQLLDTFIFLLLLYIELLNAVDTEYRVRGLKRGSACTHTISAQPKGLKELSGINLALYPRAALSVIPHTTKLIKRISPSPLFTTHICVND